MTGRRADPLPDRQSRSALGGRFSVLGLSVLFPFVLGITGCSGCYVLRAGYEELRVLCRRQPIDQLLKKGNLDPETRAKLELALAVRAFARDELGLTVDDSYTSLARVDANQIVYVVSAAPWNRLEAYTWWFPIVGRVPYRGYFDRADAEALAAKMERKGYDTYVRPSVAFSTLGWFADPLLSNLLRYGPTTLADVIIHELVHSTMYLPGHVAFNESFANFVGARGALLFFERRGDTEMAERARAHLEDTLTFARFLAGFAAELESAYAHGIDREQRERLFSAAQEEFRSLPWRTDTYQDFDRIRLNNAVIMQQLIYVTHLDLFEEAYVAAGRDLATTIKRIRQVCGDTRDPFAAIEATVGTAAERSARQPSAF
jgi:predicted aminopeptidase